MRRQVNVVVKSLWKLLATKRRNEIKVMLSEGWRKRRYGYELVSLRNDKLQQPKELREHQWKMLAAKRSKEDRNRFHLIVAKSQELPSWIRVFFANKASSSSSASNDEELAIPSLVVWVWIPNRSHKEASAENIAKEQMGGTDEVGLVLYKKGISRGAVVNKLSESDVVVYESLVLQCLRSLSNGWTQAYVLFNWPRIYKLEWELSEFFTVDIKSKLMRILAKSGRYSESVVTFLAMKIGYGVKTDSNVMGGLIDALVKENHIHRADKVSLKLEDTIKPVSQKSNIKNHWIGRTQKSESTKTMRNLLKVTKFTHGVVPYTKCTLHNYSRIAKQVVKERRHMTPPAYWVLEYCVPAVIITHLKTCIEVDRGKDQWEGHDSMVKTGLVLTTLGGPNSSTPPPLHCDLEDKVSFKGAGNVTYGLVTWRWIWVNDVEMCKWAQGVCTLAQQGVTT